MEMYFGRHGQSMGNMTGDYSTPAHDQLSPNGRQQAEQLAGRLSEYTFDAIYVSPLRRALETITPYLRRYEGKAEVWPELAEACWQSDRSATPALGQNTPLPFKLDVSLQNRFSSRPEPSFWAPEGETYSEGLKRIEQVKSMLLKRHIGRAETILVIGHDFAGGRLIELLLDIEPYGRLYHTNTGLTRLVEAVDGTFTARFVNRIHG